MLYLLVDTSVWLDLARRRDGQKLLHALGRFVRKLLRRTNGQSAAVGALASSCSVIVAVGALVINAAK